MITLRVGRAIVIACTFLGAAALTQSSDPDDAEKTKLLTKAMQNAQLLLSELADAFECNYTGYDLTPTDTGDKTTYVVIIDVDEDSCDDMVKALNYEGADLNLAFVSERESPATEKQTDDGLEPFDGSARPPTDLSLIHEIDPPPDR